MLLVRLSLCLVEGGADLCRMDGIRLNVLIQWDLVLGYG